MIVDLECIRCGAPIRRKRGVENSRIKRGRAGPYCSISCSRRHDDPRLAQEPAHVLGARWLQLTRGKFALVDEDLFDELSRYRWRWKKDGASEGHAIRSDGIWLHRLVLGLSDETVFVDHKDNNGLDCRRENLRIANRRENGANRTKYREQGRRAHTSKYKGVSNRTKSFAREYKYNVKNKSIDRPWAAQIVVDRRHIHLGHFATEEEAARAYDAAAAQHFGEFARFNFSHGVPHEHAS